MNEPIGKPPADDGEALVLLDRLAFRYPGSRFGLELDRLEVASGETLAVVGPSGCGKTTLLRLIAGILTPQSGKRRVAGQSLEDLSDGALRAFRIRRVGIIFQEFELLDYLSARDNIALPFRVTRHLEQDQAAIERLEALAEELGITQLLDQYPSQLSQGERQRVALSRALVTAPQLVLADEPTGNLDPENQRRAVRLLCETSRKHQSALIMVTHDHSVLDQFDRHIDLPEWVRYQRDGETASLT